MSELGQLGSERHNLTTGLIDSIVSSVMLRALRRVIAERRHSDILTKLAGSTRSARRSPAQPVDPVAAQSVLKKPSRASLLSAGASC